MISGKEILTMASVLSAERDVSIDVVLEALEAALASARHKLQGGHSEFRVKIDRHTGHYQTYRRWLVLDQDLPLPEGISSFLDDAMITLEEVHEKQPEIAVGDYYEEEYESVDLGRIGIQAVRQALHEKVKSAERQRICDLFHKRIGELFSGLVRRVTREYLVIEILPEIEAILPREHLIPREFFRVGERVRAVLDRVNEHARGHQLYLSRTNPLLVKELFRHEVPEINDETIEVRHVVRDPGLRAKISVKTNDGRIDPVGACVGMRGSRVQAVSNELHGERIDIVLYDHDPVQYVINALSPAHIASIVIDEDLGSIDVAVQPEQLALAIGRNGQNVRLASELTGWILNLMTEQELQNKSHIELTEGIDYFMKQLDISEETAALLVQEGFSTLEEIAYVAEDELLAIDGFDQKLVDELRHKAKDLLLMLALNQGGSDEEQSKDLLDLFEQSTVELLKQHGIYSRDDLADASTDDLMEIPGIDANQAAEWIMKARAHWYQDDAVSDPGE